MQSMIKFALISLIVAMLSVSQVNAHPGGHGKISAIEAKELALRAAKMLTFKDHGMSVGKIDKSWATVSFDQFNVVQENGARFILQADNSVTKETLYFTVSKQGEVMAVSHHF